ncbi:MAG: xylose isomerase [Acidimicrobiaceae bacterium]|nr:xylose isomerase [Acidimicrobiaceae bacterium]
MSILRTPSRCPPTPRCTTTREPCSPPTSPDRWATRPPDSAIWPSPRWNALWPVSHRSTRSSGSTWTASHEGRPPGGGRRVIRPGLCSITFRDLGADELVDLAAAAGLVGVEWGADVHVPVGDEAEAARVADRSRTAGLACPSYGSYVQAGQTPRDEVERVADTALALGVVNVRIWTPYGTGPDAPADERAAVVAGVAEAAAVIDDRGLTTSLEYHVGTLTETAASTLSVMAEVDHPGLFTYWQPLVSLDDAEAVAELVRVAGWLSHLHVYRWGTGFTDRYPLADGDSLWQPAIAAVPDDGLWTDAGRDRWAFLEYVRDDDPGQLADDATTLCYWLATGGDAGGRDDVG